MASPRSGLASGLASGLGRTSSASVMAGSDWVEQVEQLQARRQALAKEAWRRGEAALGADDLVTASDWLDRARRLAPGNPTVVLALATVWLRQGRAEARGLFEELASRHEVRAAWLGLAAARSASGDPAAAAEALVRTLSRQAGAVDDALRNLANAIADTSGAPGWCAVAGDGTLYLGAAPGGQAMQPSRVPRLEIALDGRRLPAPEPGPTVWRLPPAWKSADRLEVAIGGRPLLGSPLQLAALRRIEGCVAGRDGGIEGWAWLPADPETNPVLRIMPQGGGRGFALTADDVGMETPPEQPLSRPRRFRIPAERLAGLRPPVRVLGRDGRDLFGSPLDPSAERRSAAAVASAVARRLGADRSPQLSRAAVPALAAVPADIVGLSPRARSSRPREATIVMPMFGGGQVALRCLRQVLATVPPGARIIVVDDAGPDPGLAASLDALAACGRIRLIRHDRNRGFPASANAGLRAAAGTDAVLLNSDTLVTRGWLERLRQAAYAAPEIGTATPLSNDATILSYPAASGGNTVPDLAATGRLAALAHRANAGLVVEIPTAVGFCMYIRRDCLDAVGPFREDVFAQGYGEENDFCLRARHLGWRHVAACGVFVAHIGGRSFGAARNHLTARNLAVLNRLHPGYDQLIAEHQAADPLADARRRLDIARWRAARRSDQRRDRAASSSVLLITHDRGGGVQRLVDARIARLRAAGMRPIVLYPARLHAERAYAGHCVVDDGSAGGYPNLRFALPRELGLLAELLRGDRVVNAELHHLLGHDHAVLDLCRRLGVPYDTYIHDYAWFCPRISLLGPDRRYCGEPDVAHCEACVSDAGRNIEEDIPVAALRRRSADDLARARRVIAPSADAARRIARHFPGIVPDVVPWESDDPAPRRPVPASEPERRICLIGAIGPEKGYDVLLACARDAAMRDLKLRFIVVGHTIDDARLLETGRVFITGEYREAEATALIAAQRAHLAWLPSIWPETWCFAVSEAWRAGLDVVAFDIGAPAERIRDSGRGILLPLGLAPAALNNALLAARPGASSERHKHPRQAPFTLRTGPAITIPDQPTSARPPADRTKSEIPACPKPASL